MITWLKGMKRVKQGNYSKEVAGYRCSVCNNFQERQTRTCSKCGGEYLGKIIGEEESTQSSEVK